MALDEDQGCSKEKLMLKRSKSEGCTAEAGQVRRSSIEWDLRQSFGLDAHLHPCNCDPPLRDLGALRPRAGAPRLRRSQSDDITTRRSCQPPLLATPHPPLPKLPLELVDWSQDFGARRPSDASFYSTQSAASAVDFNFRDRYDSSAGSTDVTAFSGPSRPESVTSVSSSEQLPPLQMPVPVSKLAALRTHRPPVAAPMWAITTEGRPFPQLANSRDDDSDADDHTLFIRAPSATGRVPHRPRKSSKRRKTAVPEDGDTPDIPRRSSSSSIPFNTDQNRSQVSGGMRQTATATYLPAALPIPYDSNSGIPSEGASSEVVPRQASNEARGNGTLPMGAEQSSAATSNRPNDTNPLALFATSPLPPSSNPPRKSSLTTEGTKIIVETRVEQTSLAGRRLSGDMPGEMPGSRRSLTPEPPEDEDVPEGSNTAWGSGLYLGGISSSIRRGLATWGWGAAPDANGEGTQNDVKVSHTEEVSAETSSLSTFDSATDNTATSSELPTPEDTIERDTAPIPERAPGKSPYSSGRQTPTGVVTVTEYGEIFGSLPDGFEEEFAAAMADLRRKEEEADGLRTPGQDSDRSSFHSTVTTTDARGNRKTLTATVVPSDSVSPRAETPPAEDSGSEDEYPVHRNPLMATAENAHRTYKRAPSTSSRFGKGKRKVSGASDTATVNSTGSSTKKKGVLGLFSRSKESSPVPSTASTASSDEPQDVSYKSYGSGRSRPQSSLQPQSERSRQASLNSTTSESTEEGLHEPPSSQAEPLKAILKSRLRGSAASRSTRAAHYTVRFANATRGLGLRTIAEQEATHAGGQDHAVAWVGVGMGRYGNLVVEGENTEEAYAEQVEQIRKKWRAFGSKVQNKGWAEVRVD